MNKSNAIFAVAAMFGAASVVAGGVWWLSNRGSGASSTTRPATIAAAEPAFGTPAATGDLPRVYASDFATQDTRGWSRSAVSQTPNGHPFLGEFNNESVSLRVTDLPPHALLRVAFDLYVIRTWDGSGVVSAGGGITGPDFFTVDVDGDRNILRATFSNLPDTGNFAHDGKRQTYPSPIPSRPVVGGTASAGVHALGYIHSYGPNMTFPQDSHYTITRTFPHDSTEALLTFAGFNLQGAADESWGVANVVVEALPEEAQPLLDESQQQAAFQAVIDGTDAVAARDAFWRLVADGDATVRYLEKKMAGFGVEREKVEALTSAIDDRATRDAAVLDLADMGPVIEPLLRNAVREKPSRFHEVQNALMWIEIMPLETPTARTAATAARLLATIDSPEARRVYDQLVAKPSPVQPGTPAYEAEWRERFDRVYRLRGTETVRYIPKPFIREREKFFDAIVESQDYRGAYTRTEDPAEFFKSSLIVRTASSAADRTELYTLMRQPAGATSVGQVMPRVIDVITQIGYAHKPIEWPESLATLDMPGDWLVRPYAKQNIVLPDFERIFAEHFGRRVTFEPKGVSVPAIVVIGKPTMKFDKASPPTINLFPDEPAPLAVEADRADQWVRMTLRGLVEKVLSRSGKKCVFQATGADGVVICSFKQLHRAAGSSSDADRAKVLAAIGAQAGLEIGEGTFNDSRLVAIDHGVVKPAN